MDAGDQFNKDLTENGYAILRGGIGQDVINDCIEAIKTVLARILDGKAKGDMVTDFLMATSGGRQYDVQVEISHWLGYAGIKKSILLQPAVIRALINTIGPDLDYEINSEMMVNVPGATDGYLVKKYHQELWSGIAVNTVQTWTPIIMEPGVGGLEVIPGSHAWGHIPHRNREPIDLPSSAKDVVLDIEIGDIVIFHSLLLHRTVPNVGELPRFAVPQPVRGTREPDKAYEDLKNWSILHQSPLSQIRKRLGNPYLSPFRTLGSERTEFTGDLR